MANERVVKKIGKYDKPYYVIQERVTPQGHYIELPGIYSTYQSAKEKLHG